MKKLFLFSLIMIIGFSITINANNNYYKNQHSENPPSIQNEKQGALEITIPKDADPPILFPVSGYMFKIGLGASQIAYDDRAIKLDAELVKLWNESLSSSLTLGYAYYRPGIISSSKDRSGTEKANAIFADLNFFHTGYALNNRYAYKFGACLSSMYLSHEFGYLHTTLPNGDETVETKTEKNIHIGGGLILEHEYALSAKYTIGLKALFKLYNGREGELGLQVKFGIRL